MKLLKYVSLSLLLMNAAAFTMEQKTSIATVPQIASLRDCPLILKY